MILTIFPEKSGSIVNPVKRRAEIATSDIYIYRISPNKSCVKLIVINSATRKEALPSQER